MTPQTNQRPLLVSTGQNTLLARAGFIFFGGLAVFAVAQQDIVGLSFPVLVGVLISAGIVMSGAAIFAFTAIRCPSCGLAWVRWSIANQPHNQWLHWLYRFTACPRCDFQGTSNKRESTHRNSASGDAGDDS